MKYLATSFDNPVRLVLGFIFMFVLGATLGKFAAFRLVDRDVQTLNYKIEELLVTVKGNGDLIDCSIMYDNSFQLVTCICNARGMTAYLSTVYGGDDAVTCVPDAAKEAGQSGTIQNP